MQHKSSFLHEIWEGSKNKNYLMLVIVYSLQVGVNTAFGINIDPIFGENGLGFTSSKIALLGVAAVTMGVFSSMVNGALLKRFGRYLLMLRVFCFGTTGLLLTVMVLAPEDFRMIIAVTMIIGAMFLVPTIPIGIAFANEVSHPMNETASQGFVMMLSQAFGYILSQFCLLLSVRSTFYGLMSLVISAGLAFLLTLFIKEDLRRSKFISELKQELIDVYTDSFEGLPEELENLVSKL